jgi:hypothetical protein
MTKKDKSIVTEEHRQTITKQLYSLPDNERRAIMQIAFALRDEGKNEDTVQAVIWHLSKKENSPLIPLYFAKIQPSEIWSSSPIGKPEDAKKTSKLPTSLKINK